MAELISQMVSIFFPTITLLYAVLIAAKIYYFLMSDL